MRRFAFQQPVPTPPMTTPASARQEPDPARSPVAGERWIDSHCHLDGFARRGELAGLLKRAETAGVERMITIGTSPSDWVVYRELAASHPGRIDYSVGLHPSDADDQWRDAAATITAFFAPPHTPVALGEIGLDYFHLPKDPVEAGEVILHQEAAFAHQLQLARQLDCPVVIHSRDCFAETVAAIDASGIDWQRVVFHCFSYGPGEMETLAGRGGRASFTGLVTYANADPIREAVRVQGAERLMVETDSPYLAPVPHRGTTNEPAHVAVTGRACAELLGIPAAELATLTRDNTRRFFGLE